MIDPTRQRQLEELDQVELCVRILNSSRNELYLNMRYLDVALSSLGFQADWGRRGAACNGFLIYYGPDFLLEQYQKGRVLVNRLYLHMLFHCLFGHMDGRGKREKRLWDLACDIAMESVIDGLYQKCVRIPPSMLRRETYLRLKNRRLSVFTAEGIYRELVSMELKEKQIDRLIQEFRVDDHDLWEQEMPKSRMVRRQNQWKENRERLQTALETDGQKDPGESDRDLLEQVQAENRERYDYRAFLRKFSVLREEMQTDPDSFDPIFYTLGLSMYGNLPLIEPLETKEVRRIEEFAIVLDTSMSCSGSLIRRFLEETCSVLSASESYFRKVNIHIIQCDEKIRSDRAIHNEEEFQAYMKNFTISGFGGTDFRPAFQYVEELRARGEFSRLRGLIYFTDGRGVYPVKKPPYDTVFVFLEDNYTDISVPGWAMKVILSAEDLMGEPHISYGPGETSAGPASGTELPSEPGAAHPDGARQNGRMEENPDADWSEEEIPRDGMQW